MPYLTRNYADAYAMMFVSTLSHLKRPFFSSHVSLYMIMGDLVEVIYRELHNAAQCYTQDHPATRITWQELRSIASVTVFGPLENTRIIAISDVASEADAINLYNIFSNQCFSIFDITEPL